MADQHQTRADGVMQRPWVRREADPRQLDLLASERAKPGFRQHPCRNLR